ncbi:MAG: hypothetical protein KHX29_03880 [Prevotella buccalis]|nr:hypothetical protein [Hoylesella buccalis]
MSDTWVKDRLETQVGKQKADQIIQAIKNNDVDKIVSRVDAYGKVVTNKVDSAANIISLWP